MIKDTTKEKHEEELAENALARIKPTRRFWIRRVLERDKDGRYNLSKDDGFVLSRGIEGSIHKEAIGAGWKHPIRFGEFVYLTQDNSSFLYRDIPDQQFATFFMKITTPERIAWLGEPEWVLFKPAYVSGGHSYDCGVACLKSEAKQILRQFWKRVLQPPSIHALDVHHARSAYFLR